MMTKIVQCIRFNAVFAFFLLLPVVLVLGWPLLYYAPLSDWSAHPVIETVLYVYRCYMLALGWAITRSTYRHLASETDAERGCCLTPPVEG